MSPESLRETTHLVDRDVRQVHRNLEELAELDLIEFESDGPGKSMRPTVWYDEVTVELPLTLEATRARTAARRNSEDVIEPNRSVSFSRLFG